jgi:hypothetical protein
MKRSLLFLFLFISAKTFCQPSDFLLLKKHHQTIATFYTGNDISFTTTTGAAIDAVITSIKNDSIFLAQYIVQQVPSNSGLDIADTIGSYPYQFNYDQIKAINLPGRHFDFSASGGSLFGGGIILLLGSGVVYLADNKDFSPLLMIAGGVLAAAGYLMARNSGGGTKIGKKYKLVYMDVTSDKKQ